MAEPKVKRIDMQSNKFMANGTQYYIQGELSVARYTEFLKMGNELFFGVTFGQLHKVLTQIWETASSGNDLIASNHKVRELAYNQLNSIVTFVSRDHPDILRFCCLFINAEDEDLSKYDDRLVDQKITDWMEEGLAIEDFFFLAGNFNPEFKSAFSEAVLAKNKDLREKVERIKTKTDKISQGIASTSKTSKPHSDQEEE